jgi:hypothetical protein
LGRWKGPFDQVSKSPAKHILLKLWKIHSYHSGMFGCFSSKLNLTPTSFTSKFNWK